MFDDLADDFAEKMSSGKDEEDPNFTPNINAQCSISSFKITRKQVKKSLKKLDPSKSVNGLGPRARFLKECADILTISVTRLSKLIVKKSTIPTRRTSQMPSACAIPEAVILVSVPACFLGNRSKLRGEEIKGFHMRHCGPSGVNLSTFNQQIKLGKNCA